MTFDCDFLGLLRRFDDRQMAPRGHAWHAIPSFRGMQYCWLKTGSHTQEEL